jgi:hypothetical protein
VDRRTAEWLQVAGGVILFAALFLTWSHQYPASALSVPGMRAALAGAPRDASAWQVYSVADILLALLAVVSVVTVLASRGRVLVVLLGLLTTAFVAHAIASPPTNGLDLIVPGGTRYLARAAAAGPGETLALVGLAVAMVGAVARR